jgi:hypothetical protein
VQQLSVQLPGLLAGNDAEPLVEESHEPGIDAQRLGGVAGPVAERAEILYATTDLALVRASRRELDPVGHYARPDVFTLTVDTRARAPVEFRPDHR